MNEEYYYPTALKCYFLQLNATNQRTVLISNSKEKIKHYKLSLMNDCSRMVGRAGVRWVHLPAVPPERDGAPQPQGLLLRLPQHDHRIQVIYTPETQF